MSWRRLFIVFLFIIGMSSSVGAYDSLVANEAYYKKAIEKSKVNDYGKGRVIAVLDSGINDNNPELQGKVIAEYDFTTNSPKAVDRNGHGTKIVLIGNKRGIK